MNELIIVAEDEESFSTLLQYNLEHEGYRVANAADGEAAWRAIVLQRPDLVVVECRLPRLSGFELCRRMRLERALRATPVLLVSARGDGFVHGLAALVGADDCLAAPFPMLDFALRVRALLQPVEADLAQSWRIPGGG